MEEGVYPRCFSDECANKRLIFSRVKKSEGSPSDVLKRVEMTFRSFFDLFDERVKTVMEQDG
jgi:hypothetical protein